MRTTLAPFSRGEHAQRPSAFTEPQASALVRRLRDVQVAMNDAVIAGEGLARVAQLASRAAGSPFLIAGPRFEVVIVPTPRHEETRMALGEWVTERINGRAQHAPDPVIAEAPVLFRGAVSGVIALLRGPSRPRPEAYDVMYITSIAVLMELAMAETRLETEEALRGAVLEELRSRRDLDARQVTQRLSRFGCNVADGAVVICAEPREHRPRLLEAMIERDYPDALIQTLEPSDGNGPPRLFAVLPAQAGSTVENMLASAQRLTEQIARHGPAGASGFRRDPAELGEAIQEAELVVDVLHQSGTSFTGGSVDHLYGLLFRMFASHPEEVRTFHERTVGPLARHDDQYQTGLIDTLYTYLESNCNMNITAESMFAHRHTIAHRLRSVHELTGLDPTVSEDRERLGLGLKIHRLVAQRPL